MKNNKLPIRVSLYFLFLLYTLLPLKAQETPLKNIPDSLMNMSYDELNTIFWDLLDKDSYRVKKYAETHIIKAKSEKNSMELIVGYANMSTIHRFDKKGIIYADSIINYAAALKHNENLAWGYLYKASCMYNLGMYRESLRVYSEALEITHIKNKEIIRYLKEGISILKNRSGQHEEALKLNKEMLESLQSEKNYRVDFSHEYLSILGDIMFSYLHLDDIDNGEKSCLKGIEESRKLKNEKNYYIFYSSLGEIKYKQKKYNESIKILTECLPHKYANYGLANTYIFRGKSYWDTNQTVLALQDFHKADSIVQAIQDFSPEVVEVYTLLNKYYRQNHNQEKQIEYIDKLIYADSVLDADALYLSQEIKDKYDIPLLLKERESIIENLEDKNTKTSKWAYGLSTAFGVSLLFGLYYFRRRKTDKVRFEALIKAQQQLGEEKPLEREEESRTMDIAEDVVHHILTGLYTFEQEKEYLQPGISLQSLSKSLGTNSNYLSKIINVYYHKNFSSYMSDLRVGHVLDRLQQDSRFRQYTIKAIAAEVGFGNSESFTKAFYKKTGLYPSYFIKQLNRE